MSARCKIFLHWYSLAGDIVYMTTANVICILRIYALYNRNVKVLILFIGLSLFQFGMELYVALWSLGHAVKNLMPLPLSQMKGCLTWTPNVERTLAAWIPCIVVTFMFFVFTMAKLRRSVIGSRFTKDWSFITLLQDSSNFSPLLMILMRDGSLYFFAIFASLATQATIQVYMQGLYFTSVHPWLHVVFSCACSRLVLNLYNYGGGTDSLHCSTYVRDEQELRVIRFVGQNTYIRDPGNRS